MIIRNKYQFRGAIRIFFGALGLVMAALAIGKAIDDGLELYVYSLPVVIGCLSLSGLVTGIRARRRPPMFRIHDMGFQHEFSSNGEQDLRWQDLTAVRQCGNSLVLVDYHGKHHTFDLSNANRKPFRIVTECLSRFRKATGQPTVRDTILAAPPVLCCQKCGVPTNNLKQKLSFVLVFGYTFAYVWRKQSTTCPECLRKGLLKIALINLLPANLAWPVIVLPFCVIQWIMSFNPGHSRAVIDALEEQSIMELTA